jgi:hypothetical protein
MPQIEGYCVNRDENGTWQVVHASNYKPVAWGFDRRERGLELIEFLNGDKQAILPAGWYLEPTDNPNRSRLIFGSGSPGMVSHLAMTTFAADRFVIMQKTSEERRRYAHTIHRFVVSMNSGASNGSSAHLQAGLDQDDLDDETDDQENDRELA